MSEYSVVNVYQATRLIIRPSHRPVFDHLQYKKTEGEGLVHFSYHVNDFHVHLDRQRGGGIPHQKNKLEALSAPSAGVLPECSQSEKHRIAPGSE